MNNKFISILLKNRLFYKITSCIIAIAIIFPQLSLNYNIEYKTVSDGISVRIESFMRGEVSDIRSSELMQAVVEGYEGNTNELTYTWTNNLGTYLYIYNSHNMYNIMNTEGEIEINSEINRKIGNISNSDGGVGFAWAAVYGANLGAYKNNNGEISSLQGGISVKVTDNSGNLIGVASYNNTFLEDDISSDLNNSVFGLFIGETANLKDLLGESAIVHVDCTQSTIISGNLLSGTDVAVLYLKDGNYYVDGLSKGVATVKLSMKKNNCKFHQYSSGEVETKIYVFNKPSVKTTTTTLTLNNLDPDCKYYINGVEGIASNGVITFEGLTPNTDYQVEVQATYKNAANETKKVYTYIYTQTKPVYVGKVTVNLDDEPCDIENILGNGAKLYLKEETDTTNNYIELKKVSGEVGTYNAVLENGIYNIYSKINDSYKLEYYQQLIIKDANRDRIMNYYSVSYDGNGGKLDNEDEYLERYHENTSITTIDKVPTRKGYAFKGWSCNESIVQPGDILTTSISSPIKLKAMWNAIKDKVNVKYYINHESDNGQIDTSINEFLTLHLTSKLETETSYSSVNGENTEIVYSANQWKSKGVYSENCTTIDLGTVFENLDSTYEYSINTGIAGYDVTNTAIKKDMDEEGNTTYSIEVHMKYNPDMFVMNFEINMAKGVDKSLWPDSVDVKVTKFYKPDNVLPEALTKDWYPVESHMYTTRAIRFNEEGSSLSKYQVEVYEDVDDDIVYYYRIQLEGLHIGDEYISLKDTDNSKVVYNTTNNTYNAVVNVEGINPEGNNLKGVYGSFSQTEGKYIQQGEIVATVDIDTYDVTLNSNGGVFVDNTTEKHINNLIKMPNVNIDDYIPTREDNYTFKGWYYIDSNNNEVDVPKDGTLLNTLNIIDNSLVLYAKWASPLTITGTVSAAGTYMLNGEEVRIHSADLPNGVKILLQEVGANGKGYTIAEQDKKFRKTGINKVGKVTYSFTNIPNNEKKYQISILATNYDDTYQNAVTGGLETDYHLYNANDCEAIFDSNSNTTSTFVNIYLSFNPMEYDVEYEIDANEIKKELRPSDISTLILYDDLASGSDPRLWPTISQLDSGGIINNLDAQGKVSGSYPVWIVACNDNRLYDYSLLIDKYKLNGKDTIHTDNAPFNIGYTATSRYDYVTNKGTNILKAKLSPKNYNIILDINAGDTVNNMEDYILDNNMYGITYKWGDEVKITATPTRDKFVFMGWYDQENNYVERFESGFYGDVTLKAKWMVDNNTDGIPDEYQKEIVFRVINGKWKDGSTIDYSVYVNLKDENGQYSSNGSGELELPKDMSPIEGYNEQGSWTNKDLNGLSRITVTGNNIERLYYSFLKNNTVVYESVIDEIVNKTHTHEVLVIENEKIRVNPNGGIWNHENIAYTTAVDFVIKNEGMLIRNPTRSGYVFAGWKCVDGPSTEGIKYTFNATWRADSNNDGIVDDYQKCITFKVINGSWEDTTSVDIVKWITLYNEDTKEIDINGKGTVEIPINMIPNYGYEKGLWQGEGPTYSITKDSASLYTYIFTKIKNKDIKYDKYASTIEDKKAAVDSIEYGKKIRVNPNGGIWYYNGIEYMDICTLTVEEDIVLNEPITSYGQTFLGWEVAIGKDDVTYIYTAQYEQSYGDYGIMLIDDFEYSSYKVEYYYDNEVDNTLTITNNNVFVGDIVNSYVDNLKTGYTLDRIDNYPMNITSNSNNNVMKVYYSKDKNNDNVPDKYQAKVTYRIVNGSWLDGSKEDRNIIFNLKEKINNNWVEKESTLANTIPNDMKPDDGYIDEGSWCSNITNETVVNVDTVYTYTFMSGVSQSSLMDDSEVIDEDNAIKEDDSIKDDSINDDTVINNDTDNGSDVDKDDNTDTSSEEESEKNTITDKQKNIDNDKKDDNNTLFETKAAEIKEKVKTFDENNSVLWIVMMIISIILMISVNCYVIRKRNSEE